MTMTKLRLTRDNGKFGASFSWIPSASLSTPVDTGVRSVHRANREVVNAVLLFGDFESLWVLMVDTASPVDDVVIVVR